MIFQDFIFSASQHKVLRFLCEQMGRDFYDSEIARMLPDVSRAAANNALRNLAELGITKRYFIGNIALNRVSSTSFFVREFRKFIYVTEFAVFIDEIASFSSYAYIFGDYIEKPFADTPIASILVVSDKAQMIQRYYRELRYAKHLELLVYTEQQFQTFQQESPALWLEIQQGMKLL